MNRRSILVRWPHRGPPRGRPRSSSPAFCFPEIGAVGDGSDSLSLSHATPSGQAGLPARVRRGPSDPKRRDGVTRDAWVPTNKDRKAIHQGCRPMNLGMMPSDRFHFTREPVTRNDEAEKNDKTVGGSEPSPKIALMFSQLRQPRRRRQNELSRNHE